LAPIAAPHDDRGKHARRWSLGYPPHQQRAGDGGDERGHQAEQAELIGQAGGAGQQSQDSQPAGDWASQRLVGQRRHAERQEKRPAMCVRHQDQEPGSPDVALLDQRRAHHQRQ